MKCFFCKAEASGDSCFWEVEKFIDRVPASVLSTGVVFATIVQPKDHLRVKAAVEVEGTAIIRLRYTRPGGLVPDAIHTSEVHRDYQVVVGRMERCGQAACEQHLQERAEGIICAEHWTAWAPETEEAA